METPANPIVDLSSILMASPDADLSSLIQSGTPSKGTEPLNDTVLSKAATTAKVASPLDETLDPKDNHTVTAQGEEMDLISK